MRTQAVAKIAAPPFPAPSVKFPAPKLPKLDLDALFATQRANLAVAHEAQSVLVDAAQAIARVQHGYLEESVAAVRAALSRKEPAKPETVRAGVQAAAERTGAVTKQVLDLAVAAQRRVAELVARRTQVNVDELKALAA
jgi:hypothetical protein